MERRTAPPCLRTVKPDSDKSSLTLRDQPKQVRAWDGPDRFYLKAWQSNHLVGRKTVKHVNDGSTSLTR